MPSEAMRVNTTEEETPTVVLQNTKMAKKTSHKKSSTSKPVIRKARPLKNLSRGDLEDRMRELKKRLTTADCKTLLLRDRWEAHTMELELRDKESENATQTV
jgi:hypothetical protein